MQTAAVSPSSSAENVMLAAPLGTMQLERFLENVLKQSLRDTLLSRDETRTMAAQCHQLRALMREMHGLSRERTFVHTGKTEEENEETFFRHPDPSGSGKTSGNRSDSSGAGAVDKRRMRNRILVDLGNHFYTQAVVKDAGRIHINIGCGVVLEMSLPEADAFLRKREEVLKQIAFAKTREALRLTYRIRLVTEAIARLNERQLGLRE